ncbi:MAG: alanine dehydrogenase [Elusimicrobia bacterium RIFOXYA2_FULL_40_6]|nr:MAG: alanine dehydrogenase [Elusimicrobia bacterium RIFOXYA2_FULL_40_6]
MRIGVIKEIKKNECRVSMVPAGVEALVKKGNRVLVEKNAGYGSGITDNDYKKAGAVIKNTAKEIFSASDMIVKVKEPLPQEFPLIREGQIVFTYFHFAADLRLTKAMLERKCISVAYETIEERGTLPLLTPMSEIAGRMAVQEGAKYLEKPMMGKGVLLGGVPGVAPCKVVIIGGGIVGTNAAKMASGLGASVTILDVNLERLRYLDDIMPKNVTTLMANNYTIREQVKNADLLIGAVLIKGAKAPVLVTKEMVSTMSPGSVIVDVAVDQGGCIETIHATTHNDPVYIVSGVVHYGVANMPGAVGRTSTFALTNATFPYAQKIAEEGIKKVVQKYPAIALGVNTYLGKITYKAVADTFKMSFASIETLIHG